MAKDFTQGNPAKVIFSFALPMLIGNIFQQLYSTVDSIIVGNFVGKNAIAAVGGTFSIQFLILSLAIGFTTGMSVVISQVYGARDFDKLKRAFSTGFIFIAFLSIALGLIGLLITKPLLVMLDTPAVIMKDSFTYLAIMFLGFPALFLYNMYAAVLRAVGDSKTPLYFLIVATLVNIVLDIVFVVGFGMGVEGAAIATLIAQCVSGILCHLYIGKNVEIFKLSREDLVFDKEILRAIIKYGFPAAIQQSILSLSFLAVQRFVNFFGEDMIASFSVVNKIENFVTMPMMNIAMALSMFAGQNIGAGEVKRAQNGVKETMKMQALFCIAVFIVLPMIAPILISMFGLGKDAEVMRIGTMAIDFCAKYYFIFAAFQTLNNFHRGVGDASFSMFATLCMIFVRIPITYIMVYVLQLGEISIWMGMIIGWSTVLIANGIRYLTGGWKGKAFVQKEH
ncbi:MAG: MATE family efflux transporter [Oscillospiraceae bacterium]